MALSLVSPPLDFAVTEGELRHLGNGLFGPKARGRGICDASFSVKQPTVVHRTPTQASVADITIQPNTSSAHRVAKPKSRKHQSGSPWPILAPEVEAPQPVQLPLEPKDRALSQLQSTIAKNSLASMPSSTNPNPSPSPTASLMQPIHSVEPSTASIHRTNSILPMDTLSKCKRAQTSIAFYGGATGGVDEHEKGSVTGSMKPPMHTQTYIPGHRLNSISGCLSPNRSRSVMERTDPFATAARAAAASPILAPPLAHRLRKSQLHQFQSGQSSADLDRTVPCPVPKLVTGAYFGKHKIPFPANECIALLK
jgi:hypothetical protein